MKVIKEYIAYKKYGRCLSLASEGLKLIVTAELGPRVIYFGQEGGNNLFFEDLEDGINLGGEHFDANYKKGEKWHIYGGHRLWKSPEDVTSYEPDNAPPQIEELDNGAVFTTPADKVTGIQKSIKIEFLAATSVKVTHIFTNTGKNTVNCALWALSVMAPGGEVHVPLLTENTGWQANRNLVLWSYTDIYDPRLTLKNDGITLKQDKTAKTAIKIGTASPIGKIVYTAASGEKMTKSFTPENLQKTADFCSNIETYTNNLMIEAETLSELQDIAPGKTASHVEVWDYDRG